MTVRKFNVIKLLDEHGNVMNAVVLSVHANVLIAVPIVEAAKSGFTRDIVYFDQRIQKQMFSERLKFDYSKIRSFDLSRVVTILGRIKYEYMENLLKEIGKYLYSQCFHDNVGDIVVYNFSHLSMGSEIMKERFGILIGESKGAYMILPISSRLYDGIPFHEAILPVDTEDCNIPISGSVYAEQVRINQKGFVVVGRVKDKARYILLLYRMIVGKSVIHVAGQELTGDNISLEAVGKALDE